MLACMAVEISKHEKSQYGLTVRLPLWVNRAACTVSLGVGLHTLSVY